jgi:plasmid stabilization system protein ParE
MKVYWTDRARARLRAIQKHIGKDSPQNARNEVEKILRRSWQLAEPPEIGHPVPGYEDAGLSETLVRPYRLIYLIKSTQIDVITVLHYRQLLPQDLDFLDH